MSAAVASEAEQAQVVEVRDRADVRRQVKLVVVFALVTLALLWFALGIDNPTVKYITGERVTAEDLGTEINGLNVVWACFGVALLALVAAAVNRVPRGVAGTVVSILVGVAFFVGFIVWSYADHSLVIANPLPGTVKLATPLVFGALAGCLCERAGVINIAIEGQFLTGAFFASVASSAFYSAEMGLLGGIVAGVGIAALLAVFALRYQVNQVVLGVVLIALATGLTNFLLSQIPDDPTIKSYLNEPLILAPMPDANMPVLSPLAATLTEIPVIGPTLFNQTLLVYLMYVSVVVRDRAALPDQVGPAGPLGRRAPDGRRHGRHQGQPDPVAGRAARRSVRRSRRRLLHRRLDRLLRPGRLGRQRLHRAGRGDHGPLAPRLGVVRRAVLRLHVDRCRASWRCSDKFPPELLRASPYLATIIAVAGFVGRVRPPAADGEPYVKS